MKNDIFNENTQRFKKKNKTLNIVDKTLLYKFCIQLNNRTNKRISKRKKNPTLVVVVKERTTTKVEKQVRYASFFLLSPQMGQDNRDTHLAGLFRFFLFPSLVVGIRSIARIYRL